MKVSKEIQKKMHKIADLHSQATVLMREVDEYFEKKGFDVEELRIGNGESLEELEYGNDITEIFCDAMESGDWDYCRDITVIRSK